MLANIVAELSQLKIQIQMFKKEEKTRMENNTNDKKKAEPRRMEEPKKKEENKIEKERKAAEAAEIERVKSKSYEEIRKEILGKLNNDRMKK